METLRIEDNGRFYGVVGKNNTIVVPFEYDEIIRTFSSGLINVCKNDKWGCLDLEGNIVIPLVYDWIFPFGKDPLDTTSAKRNGKWGIIDRKGNDIIPCVYDEEIVFKHERAIVSMNGKMGMLDKTGDTVIPFQYSYLKPFVNSSKLMKVMENNKWGILDAATGSIIIPLTYGEIGELYTDYVVVKHNDYYGLVNLLGEIIVPFEYEKIDRFYHDINGFEFNPQSEAFAVLKNKKWKYILANNDYKNNNLYDWISCPFDNSNYIVELNHKFGIVNRLGCVIAPIVYSEIHYNYGYYVLYSKGEKGLCDFKGNLMLPMSYSNIEIISNKSAIVEKGERYFLYFFNNTKAPIEYDEIHRICGDFCKVIQNGKCGITDDEGNIIIPVIYDYIHHYRKKNIEVVKGNKYGIIDLSGNTIIPIIYDVIDKREVGVETDDGVHKWTEYIGQKRIPPMYGDAIIMQYDGKYGVVNSKGIELIPFEFDKIDFFKGVFIVKLKNKYGVLDINNCQIIPLIYNEIKNDYEEDFLFVKKKELWGLTGISGNEVLPLIFKEIRICRGLLIVRLNEKFGVLSFGKKQIVPMEYDEIIFNDEEAVFLVRKENRWGMLDKSGTEIIPPKYEKIYTLVSGHRLAVCANGKWGFINEKGEEVIKCIYDKILADCFDENGCEVMLNGEMITIDLFGNRKQ